jgi:hypothetical protein
MTSSNLPRNSNLPRKTYTPRQSLINGLARESLQSARTGEPA